MLVKEIMSTCIAECTEDISLERVYHLMQNCGHKVVVVVESKYHRVPIGVVTERTILEQIVGRGRNPKGLRAANVMTSKVLKVINSDSIRLCPAITDSDGAIPLIVVDEKRELCGLLPKEVLRLARAEHVIHHGTTPANTVDNSPLLGWTH